MLIPEKTHERYIFEIVASGVAQLGLDARVKGSRVDEAVGPGIGLILRGPIPLAPPEFPRHSASFPDGHRISPQLGFYAQLGDKRDFRQVERRNPVERTAPPPRTDEKSGETRRSHRS